MPSAAVNKPLLDAASPSTEPVRQIMTAVEHKIRNLEKRKSKLESYQDMRKSGKDLTADQEVAISKYEEVVQCLLCTQELLKQIQGISVFWDKEQKKLARKETATKVANEVFKVRETLVLQDLLRQFRNDPNARNDFTTGNNGAVKLESNDLELIDKLMAEGFIAMEDSESEESFVGNAHRAADHWVSTVDGKPKQFLLGATYERVRRVVRSIQDSRYFSRRFVIASTTTPSTTQSDGDATTAKGDHSDDLSETFTELAATERPSSVETLSGLSSDATAGPPSMASNDQETPIPVLVASVPRPSHGVAAEKTYLNDALPPPPPSAVIDHNSLPEELQTGAFSFLQDSELEELGLSSNLNCSKPQPTQLENGARDSHPAHVPQQQQQQQQQHQPLIPVQPPAANMLLINPIMSLPGIPVTVPGQQRVDHIVNGGVTPPMFPFPQPPTQLEPSMANVMGNMPESNYNAAFFPAVPNLPPNPSAAAGMNPVQQLVKTLHANHLHMMQSPVDQSPAIGNGQPIMMPMINGAHLPHRVQVVDQAAPNNPTRFADPTVEGSGNQGDNQGRQGSPAGVMGSTDQMTISEWDPAVGTNETRNKHNNKNNHKRETSTESSTGGDRRRPHEDRRIRQNGNESAGGYNGSRRRYMDRPNNVTNGGGGGSNYNGSRMHRNGGDGENGQVSSFRANTGKSQHYQANQHRNGGTFYRNNDPTFYGQNGVGGGGIKQPVRQGFNQDNQAQVNGRGPGAAGGGNHN